MTIKMIALTDELLEMMANGASLNELLRAAGVDPAELEEE